MHGKKVVHCIKPCIKQIPVTETYVYLPDTTGCHLDFIEYSGRTTSISSSLPEGQLMKSKYN